MTIASVSTAPPIRPTAGTVASVRRPRVSGRLHSRDGGRPWQTVADVADSGRRSARVSRRGLAGSPPPPEAERADSRPPGVTTTLRTSATGRRAWGCPRASRAGRSRRGWGRRRPAAWRGRARRHAGSSRRPRRPRGRRRRRVAPWAARPAAGSGAPAPASVAAWPRAEPARAQPVAASLPAAVTEPRRPARRVRVRLRALESPGATAVEPAAPPWR